MSEWHVVVSRLGRSKRMLETLHTLGCVDEVCAPERIDVVIVRGLKVERRVPWLGSLALARWATDDPHAWHDISDLIDVAGIMGGWLPAVVSETAVQVMLNSIQVIESKGQITGPAPCQPGDVVRFTHLAFWRIVARCVWVDRVGTVGLRVGILGREQVIPVPWAAIE